MRDNKSVFSNIDWTTVLIFLALAITGWISVYAAVYDEDHKSIFDLSQRYGKQLLWIALGGLLAFIVLLTDPKFFNAFAFPIYIVTMLMLIAVLLFGSTISGSKSWFQIGGFAIQPAEFAKFSTALALASYFGKLDIEYAQLRTRIVTAAIIILPALLILLQYDTGSALVFSAFILVFYREGMSGVPLLLGLAAVVLFLLTLYFEPVYVIIGMAILVGASLFFIKRNLQNILTLIGILAIASIFVFSVEYVYENVLETHQRTRIGVLLGHDDDLLGAGYNVHQSKIAIGSGGFSGKGFLNGTQTKFNFVPEQSTDFIFCTVGEEWGFLGSLVVVGLYISLFMRLIFLAERQRSVFARVYGYSVLSILFFHFAINIGMTIGLVPVIGIPLPFISYGGSSLWAFTIMLFVFLKQDANRLNIL
ncbi:MAG: rod shape-determining protein RodA [Bacteroidales bacterium]|nr:rod shape-determining protein RodA [Bacteroidales bacterium]MDP2237067.1 rod shape-determining protein RodA [Bacteroidales bacterium]